jgi:hypothetical protein
LGKFLKLEVRERLRKYVSYVIFSRQILHVDLTNLDGFANKVISNIDVLGSGMEFIVLAYGDRGLIVHVEHGWAIRQGSELT